MKMIQKKMNHASTSMNYSEFALITINSEFSHRIQRMENVNLQPNKKEISANESVGSATIEMK